MDLFRKTLYSFPIFPFLNKFYFKSIKCFLFPENYTKFLKVLSNKEWRIVLKLLFRILLLIILKKFYINIKAKCKFKQCDLNQVRIYKWYGIFSNMCNWRLTYTVLYITETSNRILFWQDETRSPYIHW